MTIYNDDIQIGPKRVFRSQTSEGTKPEVCGWIEQDGDIVKGSYGFWRTECANEAATRAAFNFPADQDEKVTA